MSFPLLLGSEAIQTKDLSNCVPGTVHSFCSLIDSLKAQCDEFAGIIADGKSGGIESVEANPLDGQGLMSSIHRVSIQFVDGRRFVAILKVASTQKLERLNPIEDAARKRRLGEEAEGKAEVGWDIEQIRKLLFEMCDLEEDFFKLVVPMFSPHLLHIVPIPFAVLPIPNHQHVERGFLLMEDVSTKGVQPDFYEGLTAEQVSSTIVHLAQLHAFTATLPGDLLSHFRVNEYGRLDGMDAQLADRVLGLDTPYFERHQKTLRAFISAHNQLKTDVHKRFGIRPVLCHGDLWSNNLFFNQSENGGAGDQLSSIIDWQTCHEGTGLNDVIRLIFSSVNAPLRRDRMHEWLDLYFNTVEQESHKLNIVPPMEFSEELRKCLFEEQRHFELTFVFLCFPTLFPQAKSATHRRNLIERMETLFEEGREQYEQIDGAEEGKTKRS